jgi:hypothetical protein
MRAGDAATVTVALRYWKPGDDAPRTLGSAFFKANSRVIAIANRR